MPVFCSVLSRRALLRVTVALHSFFLYLLLLVGSLHRRQTGSKAAASAAEMEVEAGPGPGTHGDRPRKRTSCRAAARRRRRRQATEDDRPRSCSSSALVEEMLMEEEEPSRAPGGPRLSSSPDSGARRNALFCRLWATTDEETREPTVKSVKILILQREINTVQESRG